MARATAPSDGEPGDSRVTDGPVDPVDVRALDDRVRRLVELTDVPERVVVEQRVLHDDGTVSVHHLVAGPGPARIHEGPAADADVTLIATEAAARALRAGTTNAQTCLADGSLRMRGNPEVLLRRLGGAVRVGATE